MILEKFPEDLIYELRMKMTNEDESIDSIRKNLEHIISARETSNRLKKTALGIVNSDTQNEYSKETAENFTLGSLHVRSEETRGRQRQISNILKGLKGLGTKVS